MSEVTRNVYVDGTWYGPDYPDAGEPPADKVDTEFLHRAAAEQVDDGDWVGAKAVQTEEEARQFGSPAPVEVTAERDRQTGEVEPVGMKAVQTEEEAAAFRGEAAPAKKASAEKPPPDQPTTETGTNEQQEPAPSPKPVASRRSK